MERIESSAKEIEDRLMEKAKAEAERSPSPESDQSGKAFAKSFCRSHVWFQDYSWCDWVNFLI
jgi:hypothetical protein